MAEFENIDETLCKTIIQLFDDDFTIPFLCRYRKDLIRNMEPLRLREIKDSIENVKMIEAKSQSLVKSLQKENLLTEEIERNIKAARSIDELEHLSNLYKPASKGSLFERAQKLGLESPAENILLGGKTDLLKLVKANTKGLETMKEVEEGVKNIMSHLIAKNSVIMDEVRDLRTKYGVKITTSQVKQKKSEKGKATSNLHKFENYFNFSLTADRIKPHQVLAINRGESLKVMN